MNKEIVVEVITDTLVTYKQRTSLRICCKWWMLSILGKGTYRRTGNFARSTNFRGFRACGRTAKLNFAKLNFAKFNLHVKF